MSSYSTSSRSRHFSESIPKESSSPSSSSSSSSCPSDFSPFPPPLADFSFLHAAEVWPGSPQFQQLPAILRAGSPLPTPLVLGLRSRGPPGLRVPSRPRPLSRPLPFLRMSSASSSSVSFILEGSSVLTSIGIGPCWSDSSQCSTCRRRTSYVNLFSSST